MNIKKKIALVMATILILISATAAINAIAANGTGYSFDESTNTLTITGNGEMDDYTESNYTTTPWYELKDKIENIIVSDGITKVGDYSFCFEGKLKNVTLPDSLTSIGTAAFAGNDNLKSLTVPASVKSIGSNSFGYNSQMKLTDGFVASCTFNSFAQKYCLQNYIAFDTPFSSSGIETAIINEAAQQCMWSFVPKTNCKVTYYSSGNDDTEGLIYDSSSYVYDAKFNTMKKSAVAYNDDFSDTDVNFKIVCNLTAGKRYYISAKLKAPHITDGSFTVNFAYECIEHIYKETVITPVTCESDGLNKCVCIGCGDTYNKKVYAIGHNYELSGFENGLAKIKCSRCDSEYKIVFKSFINKSNPLIDVVDDGIINAKDYAKLIKMFK